jgi:SPX domain protein involved in polyphosphate accumulation
MKRYEYKLSFPLEDYAEVLRSLLSNSFLFSEIYNERLINNIYFDTIDFADFYSNVNGHSERSKFRIRWYGKDKNVAAILENKSKVGEVGDKISYSINKTLNPTMLDNISDFIDFEDMNVKLAFSNRRPVLLNQYIRRYFISYDHKIRITLDRDIRFGLPTFNPNLHTVPIQVGILEIKCAIEDKLLIDQILQSLNLRMDKFSKYVSGIISQYVL